MSISDMMKRHGVERIVLVPEQRFEDFTIPPCFHAWPVGCGLTEACGRGATVEAAIHDMVRRAHREAA